MSAFWVELLVLFDAPIYKEDLLKIFVGFFLSLSICVLLFLPHIMKSVYSNTFSDSRKNADSIRDEFFESLF